MENTGKLIFEGDRDPQWYVAQGESWVGPMTSGEVYDKIKAGELSWAHFIWRKGQPEWKRVTEVKAFQAVVPSAPKKTPPPPPSRSASKVVKVAEPKVWYLHYNESQFGPFSVGEVERYLQVGKIHGRVFAWKEGMVDWTRLGELKEFSTSKSGPPKAPSKSEKTGTKELRGSPRRPLVAKILMAAGRKVVNAVCRDISVGGMQVLTDQVPGGPGDRLKLNISPTGDKRLKPFVAEGVIVRILEDGRGFSFRFEKISADSKKAIESYLETS